MDPTAAQGLEKRLNDLETRLARLEGSVPPAAAPVTPAPAPARIEMAVAEPAPIPIAPPQTPVSVRDVSDRAHALHRLTEGREKPGKGEGVSFEKALGGRAFAALGALGVVIGMGFFVKLAYDEGWLRVPPTMRCIGAAAFGAAMLGAGAWARTRLAPWAVAGLMSAGLGVMYGAGFAAYTLYALLSPAAALSLLAGVSALGAVVGARMRMSPVALLSIIAAYAAPLVVASETSPPFAMPPYLLAVCAVGLTLSRRAGRGFEAARTLSWWGLAALGALWTLIEGDAHPWYALAFLALAGAMMHGDALLRAQRLDADAEARSQRFDRVQGGLALNSFAVLAWAALLGVYVLIESSVAPEWMWPAAIGMGAFAAGLALAGHLRFGRDPVTSAKETLGATLLIGAGCAGGYALALALSGWTEVLAWLGVGVGAVMAGAWARARPLQVYGLVALSLGTVGAMVQTAMAPGAVALSLGLEWSRGTWTLLAAALAWSITARLLMVGAGTAWQAMAQVALAAGAAIGAGAFALGSPEPESLALVWIGLCALFAAWGLFERQLGVRVAAMTLGGAAAFAWGGAMLESNWMHAGGDILGLRPLLWSALLIAAVVCAVAHWMLRSPRVEGEALGVHRLIAIAGVALAGLLTLTATSLEAARLAALWTSVETARAAAVSLWWGVFGLITLAIGVRARSVPARLSGLGLILLAAAKAAIVDLVDVAPAWRVASFVGLGLLMLGVAVGYSRLARSSGRQGSGEDQV